MPLVSNGTDKFVPAAGAALLPGATSSSIHEGGENALVIDDSVDLFDIIGGCMDDQDEVQELARCLTEMEDELKAVTEDTSFLHFPSKMVKNNTLVIKVSVKPRIMQGYRCVSPITEVGEVVSKLKILC